MTGVGSRLSLSPEEIDRIRINVWESSWYADLYKQCVRSVWEKLITTNDTVAHLLEVGQVDRVLTAVANC